MSIFNFLSDLMGQNSSLHGQLLNSPSLYRIQIKYEAERKHSNCQKVDLIHLMRN